MLDFVSILFIAVFGVATVVTISSCAVKSVFDKRYFNKERLVEYERDVDRYNFSYDDDVNKAAEKVGKVISLETIRKEAYIDDKNPELIHVKSSLTLEKKNFAVGHELGHCIRGYMGKVAKNEIKLFSKFIPEEQICDYYSAAILLPRKDLQRMMDERDFHKLTDDEKAEFVKEIANKKGIAEDVVYRRICEMRKISM